MMLRCTSAVEEKQPRQVSNKALGLETLLSTVRLEKEGREGRGSGSA